MNQVPGPLKKQLTPIKNFQKDQSSMKLSPMSVKQSLQIGESLDGASNTVQTQSFNLKSSLKENEYANRFSNQVPRRMPHQKKQSLMEEYN